MAKAAFTAEEWNEVLGGVFMAGFAVTAADPTVLLPTIAPIFKDAGAEQCERQRAEQGNRQ